MPHLDRLSCVGLPVPEQRVFSRRPKSACPPVWRAIELLGMPAGVGFVPSGSDFRGSRGSRPTFAIEKQDFTIKGRAMLDASIV